MGLGTEAYKRLTDAAAARANVDAEDFRRVHWANCRPARIRETYDD